QSIQFANELFRRILIDYETGEASVIDTIQAKITLQTRMASFEKANYEFINSGLILSTHLWTSELAPLELSPQAIPDPEIALQPNTPYPLHDLLAFAEENHPEIQKLNGKKKQLAIERKWNLETLKPRLDLSYTLIDAPLNPSGDFVPITFTDNYKLGVDFYVPLFLRKERGKLEKTNLKLMETDYSLDQRKRELAATIQSRHAEIKMAETLTRQYKEMAENYHQLLQAEFLNVDLGESDLFKLTIQQDKYIEAQIKYIQNLVKFQKSKIEILHDTGYPLLALAPVTRP
ncbi:MAG: TolC family protein, partial [Cyclobacteriaceae bacterium]|nr:TolC family protein [Cyclobacteriaceae bacterium]